MSLHGRAFSRATDIRKLQAFLAEMRDKVAQAGYFQFGDLMWRIHYAPNHFDAATDLRIWDDDDGRISGFAHYAGADDNPEFFLRPELYDSPMAGEMVDWAVARARMGSAARIETSCIDADRRKAAFLSKAGFKQFDDPMVFMARRMDVPVPTADSTGRLCNRLADGPPRSAGRIRHADGTGRVHRPLQGTRLSR